MREIKFRAWDKEGKEMFRVIMLAGDTSDRDNLLVSGRGGTIQGAILIQYTGMKDKNGKEIYEGDIIKRTMHYGNDWGESVGEAEEEISEVKWGENTSSQYVGFSFFPCDNIYKLEVIGNIYSDKHLLNNKQ